MKKLYAFSFLLLGLNFYSNAQTCGDTLRDSGGAVGDYSNNELVTVTICPPNASQTILLDFLSFETEDGYDSLIIYNGNSTSAPIIGVFQGLQNIGSIVSTDPSGCLTLVFESDGSVVYPGYEAVINCVAPVTCFAPSALTSGTVTNSTAVLSWTSNGSETQWIVEYGPSGFLQGTGTTVSANSNPFTLSGLTGGTVYDCYVRSYCGGTDTSLASLPTTFATNMDPFICGNGFFDAGGPGVNYSNSTNDTITICRSISTQILQIVFSSFETEGGYDSLMVFDGPDVNSPLIGVYQDTIGPDTLTANMSNGCLTFVFTSDGSVTYSGWEAQINCFFPAAIGEIEEELLSVYPNPSQGIITLKNLKKENYQISVQDMNGRNCLMSKNTIGAFASKELDLSHLENGIYFIQVANNHQSKTYQITILK